MSEGRGYHIAEGFPGERSIVLPAPVVAAWLASRPLVELLPSDIGYYPAARWHYRERPEGSEQLIFIWCLKGEGWLSLKGERVRVRAGQAAVIPPRMAHAYGADESLPWTIYWVHMAGPKVAEAARLLGATAGQAVLKLGQAPPVAMLFEQILALLERGYTVANLLGASLVLGEMVAQVAMGVGRHGGGVGSTQQRLEEAVSYMLARLDRRLRIADLATSCNLSASHFSILFKRHTGFAPIDFFIRLKIQRACRLLESSDMPIKDVATVLGFDDPLYFSRCFHRIHACSPREYRKQRQSPYRQSDF
jgi:AraC-like DNA-binding protein